MKIYRNNTRLVFLTIGDEGYSRSWNYLTGIKKFNKNVEFHKLNSKNLITDILKLRKIYSKKDLYVVMSPSQYLVPFVWFLLGKNIILDAGWSLFEGSIISRKKYGAFLSNFIKLYLIDFIASHLSKKIFLESEAQIEFYARIFIIRKRKCLRLFTGLDESQFSILQNFRVPPDFFNNSKIVLFRGRYMAEAGLEVLAEATWLLSDAQISFWVFCPGLPREVSFNKNTFVSTEKLSSMREIATLYEKSLVSLGFMSSHSRVTRTIPHKIFESAFAGKPIISAFGDGMNELFPRNKGILYFNPGDSTQLAKSILDITNNLNKCRLFSSSIRNEYNLKCSQQILAKQFLDAILQIIN